MSLHSLSPPLLGLLEIAFGKASKARASLDRATTPEAVELAQGYLREAAAEFLAVADALPLETRRMRRADRIAEGERLRAALRRTDLMAERRGAA
jgi:hypothetical protein